MTLALWYIGLIAGCVVAISAVAWLIYRWRGIAAEADEYEGIEHPPVRTQIWRNGKHGEL